MINLLEETKEILKNNNYTLDDVEWVGTYKHYIDKEEFIKLANRKYDNGYGSQEVAENLILVGKDFWLERDEYDGSEWWVLKKMPKKPTEKLEVHTLFTKYEGTLENAQNKKEEY
jgi:hypothetical protein